MALVTKALIVDLATVLLPSEPSKDSRITPRVLQQAFSTRAWHEFERGWLNEQECFDQIERDLVISSIDLKRTIKQVKSSVQWNTDVLQMLQDIKGSTPQALKIYLMSNATSMHWKEARGLQDGWDLFDQTFISSEAQMRKPDLCFYRQVLDSIGLQDSPAAALFVDDKLENICSALTVGMQALLFDGADDVIRQIRNLFCDPVQRGTAYLKDHAGQLCTTHRTATGHEIEVKENFAQLLIFEATRDPDLVNLDLVQVKDHPRLWNFFRDRPVLTTATFPNDYDTTALALTIMPNHPPTAAVHRILDSSLANLSVDELPQVYDDVSRPRIDAVVCVHVYTLFHLNHRARELRRTWEYIEAVLLNRAYHYGTYYYTAPESFLYAVSRLISYSQEQVAVGPTDDTSSAPPWLSSDFARLFEARCRDCINRGPADAFSVASRIIACKVAGVPSKDLLEDVARLRAMQAVDGGWPWCEMYRAPSTSAGIGSRGVVTSFAVKALKMVSPREDKGTQEAK